MNSHKKTARLVFPTVGAARRLAFVFGVMTASAVASTALHAQSKPAAKRSSSRAPSAQMKRDSMTITLAPLTRTEVKLVMKKNQKAAFTWKADGAEVTYNLHGEGPDAPGGKAHIYKRGASKAETGEVVAVFDGAHGWSWRNTSDSPVTITVTAWGQFSELKKM